MSDVMAMISNMIQQTSKPVAKAISIPAQSALFFKRFIETFKSMEIRNSRNSNVKKKGEIMVNDFVINNIERKKQAGSSDFFTT